MLRPWDLVIKLDESSSTPFYLQLVTLIIAEIRAGRLKPQDALPGTREMASKLAINRKTVVLAYDELIAQGWLQTEGRRGTFVASHLPVSLHQAPSQDSSYPVATVPAMPKVTSPAVERFDVNINDGIPDSRLIPFEIISRAFRHALIYTARSSRLGYSNPLGTDELRSAIAHMLNMERGLHVTPEHICVVRGSQMGIFLTAKVMIQPGDAVVMERLSYQPARLAFQSCGAEVMTVETDEHGMNIDQLDHICSKREIRFVYVTPHHQFPTTVMMSMERRMQLLTVAAKHGFKILEDDYDHEFHYFWQPVLPLACRSPESVIYVGSLSKVLAPGLRVGYIVAPKAFIEACAEHIMIIDRQGNPVTELAAAELMGNGELKRHILKTLKIYDQRRKTLAAALHQDFGHVFDFSLPSGGLAFWLTLKTPVAMQDFLSRATQHGLHFHRDSLYTHGNHMLAAIRLGFGSHDDRQLAQLLGKLQSLLTS
ncbi:PLP-dependent aminotransferase family protein [Methylophilus sp. 3sh_L]|uniref:MocR-like pyridoxine biosynthesis transcription factor PdxR n=1 Tax=Methylophilus sp. 3sh_L TaxID=3377114 RepID=UPI00398F5E6B